MEPKTTIEFPDTVLWSEDGIQYRVLKSLLGDVWSDDYYENSVIVFGMSRKMPENKDDVLFARSSILPPGLAILVAKSNDPYPAISKMAKRYLVFEADTYGRESTLARLKELRKDKEKSAVVVMLNLPTKRASTDITSPEDAMEEKMSVFRDEGFDSVRISADSIGTWSSGEIGLNTDDLVLALNWDEPMDEAWESVLRTKSEKLAGLLRRYDALYEAAIDDLRQEPRGLLSSTFMDKILQYKTVERYKQDTIWKNYTCAFESALFPRDRKTGLYPCIDLFEYCVEDLNVHVKKDVEELERVLRKGFWAFFNNKAPRVKASKEISIEDYKKRTLKNGPERRVRIDFEQVAASFINNEMKRIIRERLEQRLALLNRVLGER